MYSFQGIKKQIPITLKTAIKQLVGWVTHLFGIISLTSDQTIVYLRAFQQAVYGANRLHLPDVTDISETNKVIFTGQEAVTFPSYVWAYSPNERKTVLLRTGNVLTEGKVLCTDFWNEKVLKERIRPDNRQHYKTDKLIAPFSHYQDGWAIGGYYDFMYLIAAKLCRIENAIPTVRFNQTVISYPLFETAYERELLTFMGFRPEHILDSRHYRITFKTCLLGNSGHWFYPNEADVQALRKRLLPLIQNPDANRERIYISRAGRRRIINEEALVSMLQQYNFRIVEDKPRTLSEQLSIYNRASLVIGPHGASFSNIIWCEPGTQLIELFSPNYAPDHFLYLAKLMGLQYSAYYKGVPHMSGKKTLEENISVSIPAIERGLNTLFEQEAHQ